MSSFHNNALVGASGLGGYQIERSLRFNSADSAYLNRTPASAGNRQAWTWSAWMKLSDVSTSAKTLFQADTASVDALQIIDAKLDITLGAVNFATTAVYRDPSAWYHIVWNYNGSTTVVYVNNVSAGSAAKTGDTKINNNIVHYMGTNSTARYFSGYLTEIHFIDGQALTPSSFGETDTITGVWKPKKYSGSGYGTNGFYLKFADNSGTTSTTLGKDAAGSNNWTPNNFSVTAGAGNDSLIDTPTPYADGGNGRGNYATLNPLSKGDDATLANGNLDVSYGSAPYPSCTMATFGMSSGKWYWETTVTVGSVNGVFGITNTSNSTYSNVPQYPGYTANGWGYYAANGDKINNATATAYGSGVALNDVIGCAFDANTGKIWWSKNGTWQASGDPAAGTNAAFSGLPAATYFPAAGDGGGTSTYTASYNFGQRSFSYTPPSGFLALNTQNLPEPSIKKPSSYFDTLLYTGNSATSSAGTTARTLTGLGFQPDLIWVKSRNNGGTWSDHSLTDTVRGANLSLSSNTTGTETNVATGFGNGGVGTSTSDGFTIVSGTAGSTANLNSSSGTYVAWCWDESATPGFDIVTYTGTGVARTIAHSLGVAPSMMIVKRRTTAGGDWDVYHSATGATKRLFLNTPAGSQTTSVAWNDTAPTSSVFTVGTGADVNQNGDTHVAYLWSEVAGFSKFGSYTGNGSTDGPFVACNFRPRWVMIKSTGASRAWVIVDTSRDTYNVSGQYKLYANYLGSENNSDPAGDAQNANNYDILSNGFKLRSSNTFTNGSTETYIFAAFAESPQKYSLAR